MKRGLQGLAFFGFLFAGVWLMSCGTPTTPEPDFVDQRVEVPAAPNADEGLQFEMPEATIPPGEEKQLCWIPDWVPDKDYHLTQFDGLQGSMGHHLVALRSGIPRKAGEVFDCTNLEQMTSLQPLILPDFINKKTKEVKRLIPDGFAVTLPKGAKIVMQSHYVNTTAKPLKVRDVARFKLAPKGSTPKLLSYLIMNHGAIKVEPGEQKQSMECTIKQPKQLLLMLGHMHDWGKTFKLDLDNGEVAKTLYQIDEWTVDMRDNAPITFFDKEPLMVKEGDRLTMNCGYNNNTGETKLFPAEMCTMVAYYYAEDHNDVIQCKK